MTENNTLLSRFHQEDFAKMQTRYRANFFNSIGGFKSAVLVGTQSKLGKDNLAIFSSLMHMGSSPAFFGLLIRPNSDVPRHTLANIEETGFYSINNILPSFLAKAHQTSAKYAEDVSEFEACGIEKTYSSNFSAPFVKSSTIRMGMKWIETIPIRHNGTALVIGTVVMAEVPSSVLEHDGMVDSEAAGTIAASGLEKYHSTRQIARFGYAKP